MGQGRFESGTQTFESVALRACLRFQTGSKAFCRRTSLSQGSKKSLSRIEHSIRAAVSIPVLFNSRRSPRGNSFRYPSQGIPADLNADPSRITAVDGCCRRWLLSPVVVETVEVVEIIGQALKPAAPRPVDFHPHSSGWKCFPDSCWLTQRKSPLVWFRSLNADISKYVDTSLTNFAR